MNRIIRIIMTLVAGLVSVSTMSAQMAFSGHVKSISIEGGPTYIMSYGDNGCLTQIVPEKPVKGSVAFTFTYTGTTSSCFVYEWSDKNEWSYVDETSVTTVAPGKYTVVSKIPSLDITQTGSVTKECITTDIKTKYGSSTYKAEGKFKDGNIVQVKNWLNGNKLSLEYKIDYSFLPYYNHEIVFDNISFILSRYLGIDFGYDLYWYVPGMYYFDKLPSRIKSKNGKEYILQYGPGQGSLYIEIKEDYDNKMLKRHKVTINW